MVEIILANHGQFVEGILQSGSMTFGEWENAKAVTLRPSEGPGDLRAKLEGAIASFDNQGEVLFSVDLWGGASFNQLNILFEEHKDKWTIVNGLNLLTLIEAYVSRFSVKFVHEIVTHVIRIAKDSIKVKPGELEPAEAPKAAVEDAQPRRVLLEGTVVGNGKIKHALAYVDSRLLHGRVATIWTKAVQLNRIIVVSDAVLKDDLHRRLIERAAPSSVKADVVPIGKMIEVAKDPRSGNIKALLLFENPEDVLTVVKDDVDIKKLNIESMVHPVDKIVASKVLSMGQEDVEAFEKLEQKGVKFDVCRVPNDPRDSMDGILKKVRAELAEA